MLGYRPTTSAVTRKKPSGTFPILFILSIKSPESRMYDQPLCIKAFKWKSRNSDAFSVGVPQLDITGLLGIFIGLRTKIFGYITIQWSFFFFKMFFICCYFGNYLLLFLLLLLLSSLLLLLLWLPLLSLFLFIFVFIIVIYFHKGITVYIAIYLFIIAIVITIVTITYIILSRFTLSSLLFFYSYY